VRSSGFIDEALIERQDELAASIVYELLVARALSG
jgi:hypothetical protein